MAGQPLFLNAFWEGTANTLNPPTTQISLFAHACAAEDVTGNSNALERAEGPFKMAYDGCGVTDGFFGTLFAKGIDEQARNVAENVRTLLQRRRTVVLNAFGLSRGGIAVLYLLQHLQDESPDNLTINAMLFDPVPGNQVYSGFPYTARGTRDVSGCAPLKRVLAIYPHEPLPWISFHAPLLPVYPRSTLVEEDVWLGCHQGALFQPRQSTNTMAIASNLSFRRIVDFSEAVGTPLQWNRQRNYLPTQSQCLEICRDQVRKYNPTSRDLHDGAGLGRVIVRRDKGQFLNKYHEALEARANAGLIDRPQESWNPDTRTEETDTGRYMLGFDF